MGLTLNAHLLFIALNGLNFLLYDEYSNKQSLLLWSSAANGPQAGHTKPSYLLLSFSLDWFMVGENFSLQISME